jgi:sulfur relay (sulfurtransferase) DsrF/TusC family protein
MRKILFIITSDPRTSARPAEAIRIAAGVSAWGKAAVSICLVGPAVLMLSEGDQPLKDEDQVVSGLPLVPKRIYVMNTSGRALAASDAKLVGVAELAQLALVHDTVVRF